MELKLNLFIFSLFVFRSVLSKVNGEPKMNTPDKLDKPDASDITWAHAVNSNKALEEELIGPVDFLEADISMGYDTTYPTADIPSPVPIMAHPPENTSDISFDTWIQKVVKSGAKKGIKLDFKSVETVEPSLVILQKRVQNLNFSLWLNADILSGPVAATTKPVQPEHFLSLCHQYFPTAVLSIGWTTFLNSAISQTIWEYQWKHVRQMADVIRCHGYINLSPNYTFPVRAIFASRSIKQLQWLLGVVPGSTLTVWSGASDPLEIEDLLRIRTAFPKEKVYYDVPEPINGEFKRVKNDVINTPVAYPIAKEDRWMTVTKGQGDPCETFTYISNDTIVFGKFVKTAVLLKKTLLVDDYHNLKVKGRISFFKDSTSSEFSKIGQELVIVLADVSLFSKNYTAGGDKLDLSESDTDVIWSALNASFLHTFKHRIPEEQSACRMFSLDTTAERGFQAWTVSCDVLQKDVPIDEAVKHGVPEVSNRKRLVLPTGPFMLGFFSSGEEYVAVYDLSIEGENEGITSGASLQVPSSLLLSILLFTFLTVMKNVFV
ncbi:uncharacterized protein LOC129227380 [Uloborus diversus]|uniref:uncharacterized protein LOC129227380 n=1 Tax=Uloborus diversus TaxID=327109 RepID=UPI0024092CC8|nr:uncharacterized protein LOC129227380 [Uloborus diversus]